MHSTLTVSGMELFRQEDDKLVVVSESFETHNADNVRSVWVPDSRLLDEISTGALSADSRGTGSEGVWEQEEIVDKFFSNLVCPFIIPSEIQLNSERCPFPTQIVCYSLIKVATKRFL